MVSVHMKGVEQFLPKCDHCHVNRSTTIRMSKEEYLDMLSKALRGIKRTDDIDVEEIQRRIEEQYTMIEDMQQWLDKFLKN